MSGIVGIICARGGSKGLPGKNTKLFAGKPLIAHAIDMAKRSKYISRVLVSTDSQEIAAISSASGADVPFLRPAELATDTSPEWLVWRHALEWLRANNTAVQAIVVLPATAPLRLLEDVNGAIELFQQSECDGVLCGTTAHRSPYFNMVKLNHAQRCSLVMGSKKHVFRRQDAPMCYDITTVCYVMSPSHVMNQEHLFDGDIRMHFVPIERSVDIDTQFDFDFAEFIFTRRQEKSYSLKETINDLTNKV